VLPAKTSTPTGQPSALHSKAITICFVTPLAIAIVADGNDVALGVGSFKPGNHPGDDEPPKCAEWRSGVPGAGPSAGNNGDPHRLCLPRRTVPTERCLFLRLEATAAH
jgi:hypothetical protein